MPSATFAAGCFWGVEAAFRRLPGVLDTSVGYMGGTLAEPSYEDVCTERTGHAEVVQVQFDSEQISYEQLLDAFWNCHDPTQLNRQGPDIGGQYRSAIFYHSPEQRAAAAAAIQSLDASGKLSAAVVTEVVPAAEYWPAEQYHQQYLEKRGRGSCQI